MTEELRDKIASLREMVPKLNASTAEAGKVVQEVETLLESLGVGIPAEVRFDSKRTKNHEDVPIDEDSFLAYGRLGGKYRISILVRYFAGDDQMNRFLDLKGEDGATAWKSVPRNEKLKSFAVLPKLLDTIVDEATRLVEIAEKTVAEVRGVLGHIGPEEKNGRKPPVVRRSKPRKAAGHYEAIAIRASKYAHASLFEKRMGTFLVRSELDEEIPAYPDAICFYNNNPDAIDSDQRGREMDRFRRLTQAQGVKDLAFAEYPPEGEDEAGYTLVMILDGDLEAIRSSMYASFKPIVSIG